MSKKARIEGDKYYTPHAVVCQCLRRVLPVVCQKPRTVLEPCAGSGSITRLLHTSFPEAKIYAVDIDGTHKDRWQAHYSKVRDYLSMEPWSRQPVLVDLIVTNPPYSLALQFCERAITEARVVAVLVRQGFLSSQKRYKFFKRHPPSWVFLLPSRPSFAHGSTDKYDYCWVVWDRSSSDTKVRWLPILRGKVRR
jgi:predicted RNA methylase